MEFLNSILAKAVSLTATDVHLIVDQYPIYRVNRKLEYDTSKLPISAEILRSILEFFFERRPTIKTDLEQYRQLDLSYTYNKTRFRINISFSKGIPVFSIRVIPNGEIDIDKYGLRDVVQKMMKVKSGMILVTGKVNSGKSTTMNAFIQEVNKVANKKIVTLEEPIEYEHTSDRSVIIQKEIGKQADVVDYYSGLINLLREDADIAVLGEIRDRKTMNVAIDLAETGGLVIGTLHTRSCGETLERIVAMYDSKDQLAIKNSVSNVLKMVVSQKLIVGTKGKLLMVPEIMVVNSTIAAQIRQEKFSVSDIEDSIHTSKDSGSLSYEFSFADLYLKGLVDMETIKENIDPSRLDIIKGNIISFGGKVED